MDQLVVQEVPEVLAELAELAVLEELEAECHRVSFMQKHVYRKKFFIIIFL